IFSRDENIDDRIGTSASYETGSVRSGDAVKRQRVSATYDFISPDGEEMLDEAHVQAYWMRQQLSNTFDATRLRDGRADIPYFPPFGPPRFDDPLMYGFPFGPYQRNNSLSQTSYGVTAD